MVILNCNMISEYYSLQKWCLMAVAVEQMNLERFFVILQKKYHQRLQRVLDNDSINPQFKNIILKNEYIIIIKKEKIATSK